MGSLCTTMKNNLHSATTIESPHKSTEDPVQPKIKIINKNFKSLKLKIRKTQVWHVLGFFFLKKKDSMHPWGVDQIVLKIWKEMNNNKNNTTAKDVLWNICRLQQSGSSRMWGCLGCFAPLCALKILVITNLRLKSSVLLLFLNYPHRYIYFLLLSSLNISNYLKL